MIKITCLFAFLFAVISVESFCTEFPCTNENDTVEKCDTSTDYFPHKLTSEHSNLFELSYHNYYKKLEVYNLDGGKHQTFILVQKGCPEPEVEHDIIFKVPVSKVAISSSTYITYIELFGERESIQASNGLYSNSPCVNKLVEENTIIDFSSGNCSLLKDDLEVYFDSGSSWSTLAGCDTTKIAVVKASQETELIKQLEWLEYFSAFYNKEEQIDSYLEDTETAFACLQSQISQHIADLREENKFAPRVLWATPCSSASPYSCDSGIWNIGTCPNYYCEAITKAGGELLNLRASVKMLTNPNSSALFEAAGDVDIILSSTLYNNSDYKTYKDSYCKKIWNSDLVPDLVPAKKNQLIFDHGKTLNSIGGTDWFESRLAVPDILVEELANIFFPELNTKGDIENLWWQNVFTEGSCQKETLPTAASLSEKCEDTKDLYVPPRNSHCAWNVGGLGIGGFVALILAIVFCSVAIIVGVLYILSRKKVTQLYEQLNKQIPLSDAKP